MVCRSLARLVANVVNAVSQLLDEPGQDLIAGIINDQLVKPGVRPQGL
jgi:hypothetical protein